METGSLVTLTLYFVLMLAIGVYAWWRTANTSEGFLLAGRDLSPSVTALSAGASD
ncbi:MAG: sodium:proline symporter, partial [Alphaproteobacteria bacterium]